MIENLETPRLLIVEGIPPTGKTTLANYIPGWLASKHFTTHLYLEGDLDHPPDFESVAALDPVEYSSLREKYP